MKASNKYPARRLPGGEASVPEDLLAVFQVAGVGLWRHQAVEDRLHLDAGWMSAVGLESPGFTGSSDFWLERMHPDDRPVFLNAWQALIGGPEDHHLDVHYRLRHESGDWIWMRSVGKRESPSAQPVSEESTFCGTQVLCLVPNPGPLRPQFSTPHRDCEEIVGNLEEAEAALEASETRYRHLFESSRVCKLIVDPEDGRIVDANRAAQDFYGYDRKALLAMQVTELNVMPPDELKKLMKDTWSTPMLRRWEFQHRMADGTVRDVDVYSEPVPYGERVFLHSIVMDVTEARRAVAAERLSHSLLEATIESTGNGILVVSDKGNWVRTNRQFLKMWNIQEDLDVLSEPEQAFSRILGQVRSPSRFLEQIHEGRILTNEEYFEVIELADGRVFEHASMPQSLDGKVVGRVWNFRDVTEQRRSIMEHQLLIYAIEQAGESIVITDTRGTIEYVNPAFERVTGYRRSEALGQNPRILKSGIQDPATYAELWRTLSRGKTWSGRLVNRRKNGEHFTEDAIISPVRDSDGQIVNFVAVKKDISRELILEEQFNQAQKLDSVGRLAGGVAHDFNNMLTVILGHSEMALLQLEDGNPMRGFIEEIKQAAERSAGLTRQLLAFARKQSAAPVVLNLNHTLDGMLKMLRRLIGERIKLEWHPGSELWDIKVDPIQIDQILANLCINARDAIEGDGILQIQTSNLRITEENHGTYGALQDGEYVCLRVSDDGSGIAPGVMEHIFEPFFTTKEQDRGTGLGLATVYGIVKQNDGHIRVRSGEGEGTTFLVLFPREVGKRDDVEPGGSDGARCLDPGTVLLVEDEAAILQIETMRLESLGMQVVATAHPEQAAELLESRGMVPDILISDVIMPGMTGFELSKQLQEKFPDLRCLLMSGYTGDALPGDFRETSHTRFLQKPFSTDALVDKLHDLMGSDP